MINLVTAKNITAHLQGRYPWTEEEPLLLTDVSVDALGGNVLMKQLRMPQHDPALLRLNNSHPANWLAPSMQTIRHVRGI